MIDVARTIRERPRTIARTLRETFGVGLSDLGDALSWGEAKILIEEAASDPATHLGAELAEWAYPASMRDLLGLVAAISDQKAARRAMPWAMKNPRNAAPQASAEEVAAATAELEGGIVFT